MSRYGTVAVDKTVNSAVVQSANPEDLQRRVNAVIAKIAGPAGENLIAALTLAGAGDGHTFTVTIEWALGVDFEQGGLTPDNGVVCYMGSQSEALLAARLAANGAGPFADAQVAGASSGTRFMGMLVFGTVVGNGGGDSCLVRTGFDCPIVGPEPDLINEICLGFTGNLVFFLFPRQQNVDGNPLVVPFPAFTAGNVLKIDWAATWEYVHNGVAAAGNSATFFPILDLNGTLFLLGNFSQTERGDPSGSTSPNRFHTQTGQAHVLLTDQELGGVPPKVHLGVGTTGSVGPEMKVFVTNQDPASLEQDTSLSLQATELRADCVFQRCETILVDTMQMLPDPPFGCQLS